MGVQPGSVRGLGLMSAPLLDLCPECGQKALVYRNARIVATEPIKVVYNRMGGELGPDWAQVGFEFFSEAIRCAACHAIRGDLVPGDRRVVVNV